jgi:rod shape-determining protein MreC
MNSRHRFEISPRILLIILTVVCMLLLTVSALFSKLTRPFAYVTGMVIVPMQSGINRVGSFFGDKLGNFRTMHELSEENERLKEKVKELTEKNQRLASGQDELEKLQKLYELDSEYKDYKKVGARVISRGGGNWYETFIINKGSADGIKVDMNVIADEGLVGIVIETGRNYAKVRPIVDDNSNVSARAEVSEDTCVVKGNSEKIRKDGAIDVVYISKDAEMTNGEMLMTSHISSKYLPGIRIGYVNNITKDPSNLTQSAEVSPLVDFEHLDEVLVITDLKSVPGEGSSASSGK